jgi:hypothetical protein
MGMIRTLFRGVVVLLYLGWIIVAVMMSLDTGGGEALKNGVSAAVIGLLALGLGWLALIILSWLLLMLSHITSYKYWLGAVVGGILLLAHLPLPQVVAGGVGTGVAAFILSPVFKYMGGLIEYLLNTTTAAPNIPWFGPRFSARLGDWRRRIYRASSQSALLNRIRGIKIIPTTTTGQMPTNARFNPRTGRWE